MSSQASLRCRERRKSAGARLQSASQCDPLSSKDSGYGPKNSEKEATTAQQRPMSGIPELHTRVPRRRVKSALETRREQEASHIFQEKEKVTAPVDPQWGMTKYSEDFGPKKRCTPVPMRPASKTRRNNPHPSNVSDCLSYI